MKKIPVVLFLVVFVSGVAGWGMARYRLTERHRVAAVAIETERRKVADYLAGLVRDSDEIVFDYGKVGPEPRQLVKIEDAEWKKRFARFLAGASYAPVSHGLWITTPAMIFYRNHAQILEVELFGSTFRGYSERVNGDFEIDEAAAKALQQLSLEKNIHPI